MDFQPHPALFWGKVARIDFLGLFLFTGSITPFLISITWGGVMYSWDSWRTITPLLTGICGLLLFTYYETRYAKIPIIPLSMFGTGSFIVSCIGTVTHGLILWCGLYYLPLFFQAVKGYSPIWSGVAMFPVTLTVIPAALVTGIIVSRTGHFRPALWAGWLATTLGLGLTCFVDVNTQNILWVLFLVIIGFGLGLLFCSLNVAVLASASEYNQAEAATAFTFFRALGQTLGVAIGGTIFSNRIRANVLPHSLLKQLITGHDDTVALVDSVNKIPDPAVRQEVRQVYVDSLRIVWVFCCSLSGLAGVLSFWTRHHELGRRLAARRAFQDNPPNVRESA